MGNSDDSTRRLKVAGRDVQAHGNTYLNGKIREWLNEIVATGVVRTTYHGHLDEYWVELESETEGYPIPRKVIAGETPGYHELAVYYVPTGLEVEHVTSVDLDKEECWQHVYDPVSKTFKLDGPRAAVRRLRGEFEIRRRKT